MTTKLIKERLESKSAKLYANNKLYKKLFNLLFSDFGWDATFIHEDCLKLYKLVKKYGK